MDEKKLKALAAELAKGLKTEADLKPVFTHVDKAYRRNGAQCRTD
ncbi:transposase [Escherichia coli]|nr:transposase [Escherichia coli]SQY35741.1 transposase [Escherichia coli]